MNWILIIVLVVLAIILITRKKKDKKSIKTIPQPQPDSQEQQIYATNISDDRLREIENEITTDKKKYLQNCQDNYTEYVTAAQQLFAETYEKMDRIDDQGDPWTKYNSKIMQLKKDKDIDGEMALLEKAVADKVYTPGTYERLAILYGKKKDIQAAYNICQRWFDTDYWKIPNMSASSIKLLERMEKLEKKLKNNIG